MPLPTDTIISEYQDEKGEKNARNAWIDLIHGGNKANWRTIEAKNAFAKNETRNYVSGLRGDEEIFANGNVSGKWIERGSNNQCGNIMVMDYDVEEDYMYAVGGGGPMFKGDMSGFNWEVVNDKFRFSTDLLKIFSLDDGTKRIVSAINGNPYYSDDDGHSWVKSTGVINPSDGWNLYASQIRKDGEIFFLAKRDWWSNINLYYSNDFGVSYQSLKSFNTNDSRNVTMTLNKNNEELYLLEQVDAFNSKFYKFNETTNALDYQYASPFGFGSEGRANLQAVIINDTTTMYAYDEANQLKQSKDLAMSWEKISTLPASPWDVALHVSGSNPKNMIIGEVNAYRSVDGGKTWLKINDWSEYYSAVYTKLHADIMNVKEFNNSEGKPFTLISNHGGLYLSNNYGRDNSNLSISGLNVSQYYDVRTNPLNVNQIFAGSQDQGLQRGFLFGQEPSDFYQNISGDYGHITFTANGTNMWTVYPGGSISHYSNPASQNYPDSGYEINSSNETVWIPPIMADPDQSKNIIYAAGGSINSNSNGSYIIKLEYLNGDIISSQLPYDFRSSGGQISAMAVSPLDHNVWYVATTNGAFYKSIDGGMSFTLKQTMTSEAHYLYGSCILPSNVDINRVYLSGNGYSNKPVYVSNDGGNSFAPASTGLPSTTVFNLASNEDESLIFGASESGPFVYVVAESKWYSLEGSKTPNQTYWSVEYVPQIKTARFATYGRGIWDFQISESTSTYQAENVDQKINIFPNPSNEYFEIDTDLKIAQIELYNANGNKVLSQAWNGNTIDINRLNTGIYFVSLITKDNKKHSKKIIKL